jgi:hypothetical protein
MKMRRARFFAQFTLSGRARFFAPLRMTAVRLFSAEGSALPFQNLDEKSGLSAPFRFWSV